MNSNKSKNNHFKHERLRWRTLGLPAFHRFVRLLNVFISDNKPKFRALMKYESEQRAKEILDGIKSRRYYESLKAKEAKADSRSGKTERSNYLPGGKRG